ncbi:MAG: SDR family NAD(P)-dependent oxidoreductase [Thermoleophilia bacterium]|nr:SDR family NAD(P)-dependent oxidoreductase [Thermoleophilia bacterium]
MDRRLAGRVALVAGATRGAGRGIACALGRAGATVYCSGRSARGNPSPIGRPETIEETAELVAHAGGIGIPIRVDHTQPAEVQALIRRVRQEQDNRLEILVNDISGDSFLESSGFGDDGWRQPFWELTLQKGLQMQAQGVHSHIITAYYALPMMVARRSGLVVELSDGYSLQWRGRLFYDLAKVSTIRIAYTMAEELRAYNVAAVAVTPGYLRSEQMLEKFGVTETNWREGIAKDPNFARSESPYLIGELVAALAADPKVMEMTGQALGSGYLSRKYGIVDTDGRPSQWYPGMGHFTGKGFEVAE